MNEKDAQRAITASFIAADPTTVVLVPRIRGILPDGSEGYITGTPRSPQTFKMSLLAYDQRPTVTVNGVERLIDYHMIGTWDCLIGVGDTWTNGSSRYEVVGFSDGFQYETKAFVIRHLPPEEVPS